MSGVVQSPRDLRGKDGESSGDKSGKSRGGGRGTEGADIKEKNRNTKSLDSIGGCARGEMGNEALKAI